jgi:hypothetical protein
MSKYRNLTYSLLERMVDLIQTNWLSNSNFDYVNYY